MVSVTLNGFDVPLPALAGGGAVHRGDDWPR
jgi:hypothetical protein